MLFRNALSKLNSRNVAQTPSIAVGIINTRNAISIGTKNIPIIDGSLKTTLNESSRLWITSSLAIFSFKFSNIKLIYARIAVRINNY